MRKNFRRLALRTLSVLCAAFIAVSSGVNYAVADSDRSEDDIRKDIDAINKRIEDSKKEISDLEDDIEKSKELADNAAGLLADQKNLYDYYNNLVYFKNEDIAELEGQIADTQADIDETAENINSKENDIEKKQKENEENLEKFAQMIRSLYVNGNSDIFAILSGSGDFYDFMVRSEIVNNISNKNLEFMNTLMSDIDNLKSEINILETDKANLQKKIDKQNDDKTVLENEKSELEGLEAESSKAVQQYADDYNKYYGILKDAEYKQDALQDQMEADQAAMEAYQKELEELIKKKTNPERPFQEGEWIWPVPGFTYITTQWGWDYYFGYARWHKGLDIGDWGINGTPIYSTKAGTVIVAQDYYTPGYSYGKYIVIDHGGGYTSTYAHCSQVNVYEGQFVEQGEIIGYVGSTGWSTGPHLHFEIRVNGEDRDPFNFVSMY